MERTELLRYLDFAREHGGLLAVTGTSERVSKIHVDGYQGGKLRGRFAGSGREMSYRFENIRSCHFASPQEQRRFEEYRTCLDAYGAGMEEVERLFTHYQEYYKQIVSQRKEQPHEEALGEPKTDLKKLAADRLETIFHQAYLQPESLLTHYLLATPADPPETAKEQPILLLSRSNFSQKQAIEKALSERISVIEGPPGTGKTTTILSILANLVISGKRVVVVSKNNSAIENIKEELDGLRLPPFYLRLGNQQIMRELDHTLRSGVQETLDGALGIPERAPDEETLHSLYKRLKAMEADINRLVEMKNRLQEDENALRHMEKRREAFREEPVFRNIDRFQNRGLESMRREIDRIAHALQRLDYTGRYSIWDRIKNSFIWRLDVDSFKSEGLLLQFRLESIYLQREIEQLSAELERAGLREKQRELAELYDRRYINVSTQALAQFLRAFYTDPERRKAAEVMQRQEGNLYRGCKQAVRAFYPVILTTADALVYNFSDMLKGADKIDCVIMDEASQCDLITGLPVLHLAERCIIVGDQKQLSAITDGASGALPAVKEPYDYFRENLLSSVQKVWSLEPTLLREHYRCDYMIINYCNKFYYNGELIIYTEAHQNAMQMVTVDQGKYAQPDRSGSSFCNEREIRAIEELTGPALEKTYVITPFKAQGEHLRSHFHCGKDVCGTIHTFQGRGQDTVFFSTVLNDLPFANNHLSGEHCLFKKELLNVAVSRAKKRFVMVADAPFLHRKSEEMRDLIDYINSYGQRIPDKTVCLFDGLYRKMRAYTPHDNLDNIFEETVYRHIDTYISRHPQMYCRVKLPLANLITDQAYLDQDPAMRAFVLHHNTHVDFTLCNAIDNPVLAIELDGRFHNTPEQRTRDEKKDAAIRHMRIPLWRLSSKAALTAGEFERQIDTLLNQSVLT